MSNKITQTQFFSALTQNGISTATEANGVPSFMLDQFNAQSESSQTDILARLARMEDLSRGDMFMGLMQSALNMTGQQMEDFITQASQL